MELISSHVGLYNPRPSLSNGGSQSMILSQLSKPKSHPIQVTGEDVEHAVSTLELAQMPVDQPWDHQAAEQVQATFTSKQRQHASKPSRSHSRNSSFGSAAPETVQPIRPKGYRLSNTGEQPATSHFVLPGKRPVGRAVMQEPPLSTRSSYRMDAPWENAPQDTAQSFSGGIGAFLCSLPMFSQHSPCILFTVV